MIPPSYRRRNVPTSNLNPGRVNCQTREAAPRAKCMKFFSKIYEIPRAAAVRVLCASFVPVKFTVLNLVLYDVACEAWWGTPRALPCFFVNLRNVYVMRAKLRHILCKAQLWFVFLNAGWTLTSELFITRYMCVHGYGYDTALAKKYFKNTDLQSDDSTNRIDLMSIEFGSFGMCFLEFLK